MVDHRDINEKDPSISMFYKKVHQSQTPTQIIAYDNVLETSRNASVKLDKKVISQ